MSSAHSQKHPIPYCVHRTVSIHRLSTIDVLHDVNDRSMHSQFHFARQHSSPTTTFLCYLLLGYTYTLSIFHLSSIISLLCLTQTDTQPEQEHNNPTTHPYQSINPSINQYPLFQLSSPLPSPSSSSCLNDHPPLSLPRLFFYSLLLPFHHLSTLKPSPTNSIVALPPVSFLSASPVKK
jgi:hypothetical protein